MIVPVVVVITVGLVATVYNFVERNKLQRVHITINGVSYKIDAPHQNEDKGTYYSNWTIDFCSREGPKLGFDVSTFGQCTSPLLAVLQQKPVVARKDRYIQIDIHPHNEAKTASSDDHAALSSVPSEVVQTSDGVVPVVEHSAGSDGHSEVATPAAVLHKIPLEINSITYIFEYAVSAVPEERQATGSQLASAFCSAHGESLIDKSVLDKAVAAQEGESSESVAQRRQEILERLLREECSKPITGALVANMLYPDQL